MASADDLADLGLDEDELQSLPSGARKHLRDLARDNRDYRRQLEEQGKVVLGVQRQQALDRALKEAGVEGVSVEDIGEIDPAQVTPTLIKVKAAEKQEARAAVLEAQAKELGYASAEDYRKDLDAVKAAREARAKAQGAQAAVVGSSPAGTGTEGEQKKSASEIAHEAAEKEWQQTGSREAAQLAFIRTMEEHAQQAGEQSAAGAAGL